MATWRYDLLEGAGARAALDSVEVVRSCHVNGLTIAVGDSDPAVIVKICDDAGFPGFGTAYPITSDTFKGATLQDVAIRSRNLKTNSVHVDLIYRKRGNGANPAIGGSWTLEDSGTISHVQTASTADGIAQIKVWYKAGEPEATLTAPAGSDQKIVQMNVMRPSRIFRATAHMTAAQWSDFKAPVRQTVGLINSEAWGGSPVGTWFHAPISVQTTDRNKSVTVTLTFLEQPFGWYGLGVYYDPISGKVPPDIATEATVRGGGPPPAGAMNQRNGIVIASLYGTVDFNLFPFSPADV